MTPASSRRHVLAGLLLCGSLVMALSPQHGAAARPKPAPELAPQTLEAAPGAQLPLYVSRDWSRPLPDIERAVIVVHGHARNASEYFSVGLAAQAAAGDVGRATLIVAPQFIDQLDVDTFGVPANILRYSPEGWEGGDAALGPVPVSSFTALDAVLARLADHSRFPNLKTVVLAGHSGGAQVVQRYAIVGRGAAQLAQAGIALRFVVANPSSYAYFSAERPVPSIAASCPRYDDWKYGMQHLPPYAAGRSPVSLEQDYVAAHVVYLLGTRDNDPEHPVLDRSCMGRAQGADRWSRGHAYLAAMRLRDHGAPHHVLHEVAGVGHDARGMLTSVCGLAALFDRPGCD
ncbi:MAG TPA: alpha/beta hydrolase [Burkholderiaceae bacterium]|nr:alpha/beta hydrolase [Burkholderiaceae bacterium]